MSSLQPDRRRVFAGGVCTVLTTSSCAIDPVRATGTGARRAVTPDHVWTFDRLDRVGGVPTRVEGQPRTVGSPFGRAVQFDGVDDALFVDLHPLAGVQAFTVQALFRPDGGAFEQRWLHLQAADPAGAAPVEARIMFEIRVRDGSWWLDAFINGPGYKQTLIFPEQTHPVGRWAHVAQTHDGRTYRAYVNGRLQGEAATNFAPQGPGGASIGTRFNRRDYFCGAVRELRFSARALAPGQFSMPPGLA